MLNLKKNAANIITSLRIVATAIMIFMPTLSRKFFIAYTFAGVTDVLDGFVARKTGTVSTFGSKLDSIADLFFYVSMMIKILPYLIAYLPSYIMLMLYTIVSIRVVMYVLVGISRGKLISNHTIMNKITGLMVFFLPFVIRTPIFKAYSLVACIVAFVAAIYEVVMMYKQLNKK